MQQTPKSEEELWYEIPGSVWVALGTRGMEQMSLRQCFNPNCPGANEDQLHPKDKISESVPVKGQDTTITRIKYRIHCEACKSEFYLVRDIHKMPQKPENPSNEENDEDTLMERIYATDLHNNSWGELGWVQNVTKRS
jgi:hypothetical protein